MLNANATPSPFFSEFDSTFSGSSPFWQARESQFSSQNRVIKHKLRPLSRWGNYSSRASSDDKRWDRMSIMGSNMNRALSRQTVDGSQKVISCRFMLIGTSELKRRNPRRTYIPSHFTSSRKGSKLPSTTFKLHSHGTGLSVRIPLPLKLIVGSNRVLLSSPDGRGQPRLKLQQSGKENRIDWWQL